MTRELAILACILSRAQRPILSRPMRAWLCDLAERLFASPESELARDHGVPTESVRVTVALASQHPHCVATGGSSFRLGESPASASCPKPLSAELPPRAQSVGPFPGDRKSLAALSRGTHRADLKAIRDSVHPAKQPPQPDLLWDTISSHQCRNQPRRRRKPHALSPMTTATIGWRPLPAAEFEVHQLARSSPMESNLRTA